MFSLPSRIVRLESLTYAFEQLAIQIVMKLRPRAVEIRVVAEELLKVMDLGVEVVEVVQGDRLERHGQLRAPNWYSP